MDSPRAVSSRHSTVGHWVPCPSEVALETYGLGGLANGVQDLETSWCQSKGRTEVQENETEVPWDMNWKPQRNRNIHYTSAPSKARHVADRNIVLEAR